MTSFVRAASSCFLDGPGFCMLLVECTGPQPWGWGMIDHRLRGVLSDLHVCFESAFISEAAPSGSDLDRLFNPNRAHF